MVEWSAAARRGFGSVSSGVESRKVAVQALERVASKGAFANLALGPMLDRANLSDRDRGFVTELVYGTTRMRRALDYIVDPFVKGELDPHARAVLQMGTYQLHFMDTPPHAAVDATVGASKKRVRGLVNAVLRKVATATPSYPSHGVRLSYPDWIIEQLTSDLGEEVALEALAAMNRPAMTNTRADGYVQDPASQAVVELVNAQPGELILDLCAAPGGKATGLAATGANVIGGDLHVKRSGLMAKNARRLNSSLASIAADARAFPVRGAIADAVLLDAPCSGLGSLRRRPDARWRIDAAAPKRLGVIQAELLRAAATLVKPGGRLVYSVCTLTAAETTEVIAGSSLVVVDEPVISVPDELSDGMWSALLQVP